MLHCSGSTSARPTCFTFCYSSEQLSGCYCGRCRARCPRAPCVLLVCVHLRASHTFQVYDPFSLICDFLSLFSVLIGLLCVYNYYMYFMKLQQMLWQGCRLVLGEQASSNTSRQAGKAISRRAAARASKLGGRTYIWECILAGVCMRECASGQAAVRADRATNRQLTRCRCTASGERAGGWMDGRVGTGACTGLVGVQVGV